MQIYAVRMCNFLRFGEEDNSIVFDPTPEQVSQLKNANITMDQLYDSVIKRPYEHVQEAKGRGLTNLIGICGMNGAGKSTILEAICYAFYDQLVRRTANNDKIERASGAVITRINNVMVQADESFVEVLFEEKGETYRLKRIRKISKGTSVPRMEFVRYYNGGEESLSGHRSGDVQESILKVIDMSYDLFSSSLMFGQNDSGRFIGGEDKSRKKTLIELLHLNDVVKGCTEKCKEMRRVRLLEVESADSKISVLTAGIEARSTVDEIKVKIADVKTRIKSIEENVVDINGSIEKLSKSDVLKEVENLKVEGQKVQTELFSKKTNKDNQEKEWKNILESTKNDVNECKDNNLSYDKLVIDVDNKIVALNKAISSFNIDEKQAELAKIVKYKDAKPKGLVKKEEANKLIISCNKTIAGIESNISILEDDNDLLAEQLKKAGDKAFTCDKCKSVVTREHIENKISDNNTKIASFKAELSKNTDLLKGYNVDMAEIERRLKIIEEQLLRESVINSEISKNDTNKERLKEFQASIGDYKTKIEKNQKSIKDKTVKISEYEAKLVDIDKKYREETKELQAKYDEISSKFVPLKNKAKGINDDIATHKQTLSGLDKEKSACSLNIGSLEKEIEVIISDKAMVEKLQISRGESATILATLDVLDEIFGVEGIQTRIVRRYLPTLNVYIRELLSLLSDGQIFVEFYINQASKVDVDIKGNAGNTYTMLSGGEKNIVRLAVSIGLSILSFQTTSSKPELICLDECLGPLDSVKVKNVFKLLEKLQKDFSRVFLISHDFDVNEKMPFKIRVEKEMGNLGYSKIKGIEV